MKGKFPPYVIIDSRFNYADVLTGILTALGSYPGRFDHGNIEYAQVEEDSSMDGMFLDRNKRQNLVGIQKPKRLGNAFDYRIIMFNFSPAGEEVDSFKDFCETKGCAVYETGMSGNEPGHEIFSRLLGQLKTQADLMKALGSAIENTDKEIRLIKNALKGPKDN